MATVLDLGTRKWNLKVGKLGVRAIRNEKGTAVQNSAFVEAKRVAQSRFIEDFTVALVAVFTDVDVKKATITTDHDEKLDPWLRWLFGGAGIRFLRGEQLRDEDCIYTSKEQAKQRTHNTHSARKEAL